MLIARNQKDENIGLKSVLQNLVEEELNKEIELLKEENSYLIE